VRHAVVALAELPQPAPSSGKKWLLAKVETPAFSWNWKYIR